MDYNPCSDNNVRPPHNSPFKKRFPAKPPGMLLCLIITIVPFLLFSCSSVLPWYKGSQLSRQRKHLEAIDEYQKALEMERAKSQPSQKLVAFGLNAVGYNYTMAHKAETAIEYFKQALEINETLGNNSEIVTGLTNIGTAWYFLHQYDKALENFNHALEVNKRIKDKDKGLNSGENMAIFLDNMGSVYAHWGKHKEAITYYKKALDLNKVSENEDGMVINLSNLGVAHGLLGESKQALQYHLQSYEIAEKINKDFQLPLVVSALGQAYQNLGMYDQAMKYSQQALATALANGREEESGPIYHDLGFLYDALEQYDKAIECYQKAAVLTKKYRKNESAGALHNLGIIYQKRGQLDEAIASFLEALQVLEGIRRTAPPDIRRDYLAQHIYTYQLLASVFVDANQPAQVLEAIEQSRARLLAERLNGKELGMSSLTLQDVQRGLTDNEGVILFGNIDLSGIILMAITNKNVLVKRIERSRFLIECQKLYNTSQMATLERERGQLIETANRTDSSPLNKNGQQATFETAIHYYRALLANPQKKADAREFARLFYELLMAPAGDILRDKTDITVMPDGILGFLPFETLVDKENNYLVQTHEIHYTQSLTINKLLRNRDYTDKISRKPMLALGGVRYDRVPSGNAAVIEESQLSWLRKQAVHNIETTGSARSTYEKLGMADWLDLPGSLTEVLKISEIIKNSDILTGGEASEGRVKQYSHSGQLAQYKVVHFATHGMVVPQIPELSALVLSQSNNDSAGEDGYLRMGEIAELRLTADFVNLSACETGLGKIYSGEGIVGLTQSFLIAGANGLSVSLWQVNDESTSLFMTKLYEKVRNNGMTYRQALTEVKRDFLNGKHGAQWQSPYYWSPFVYYGL